MRGVKLEEREERKPEERSEKNKEQRNEKDGNKRNGIIRGIIEGKRRWK